MSLEIIEQLLTSFNNKLGAACPKSVKASLSLISKYKNKLTKHRKNRILRVLSKTIHEIVEMKHSNEEHFQKENLSELVDSLIKQAEEFEKRIELKNLSEKEIKEISQSINVNTLASTPHFSPGQIEYEPFFHKVMEKTGNRRILDLGCGTETRTMVGYSEESSRRLVNAGAKYYEGVDLGIKEDSGIYKAEGGTVKWKYGTFVNKKGALKWEYHRREIFDYLAHLPENYGHILMAGIDTNTTKSKYRGGLKKWSFHVWNEMKRVVPNNGFIILWGFLFNNGVREKASNPLLNNPYTIIECPREEDFKKYQIMRLKEKILGNGLLIHDEGLRVNLILMAGEHPYDSYNPEKKGKLYIEMEDCLGSPIIVINRK